jgi:hypothetical protein
MTSNRRLHYSLILGLGFLAHGLLLLNDGIYWDDWYLHVALSRHNWPAIALLGQRGIPTDPYLYWIIGYGGRVFAFKLVKFVSIVLTAVLVYESGLASHRIPPAQALAIAALSLTYPGDETSVVLMTADYYVYYVLFWLAVFLALRAEPHDRKLLWLASIVFFLISFNLNSLLVFYFGFLIVMLGLKPPPRRLTVRHLILILLPFIFWSARVLLFPPRNYFSAYNRIDLNPLSLLRQISFFAYFAGFAQLNEILRQVVMLPLVAAVACIISWFVFSKFNLAEVNFGIDRHAAPRRLLFGFLLALLAIVPYASVGKAPTAVHGPNTRCELLLGVPIACIIVWAVTLLFNITNGLTRPAFLTLMLVLTGFTLQRLRTYVAWEAEWARERAMIFSLAQHPEGMKFSTLWLCTDGLQGNPYFVTGIDALLLAAWGPDSGVLIDLAWSNQELRLRHPDEFQHPDRVFVLPGEMPARVIEPQGTLSLCALRGWSDVEIAERYLLNRFFRPDRRPTLYQKLVAVQFHPGALPLQARGSCCQ